MAAATAPIRPLAWEPPHAAGAAQEMAKRQKKKKTIKKKVENYALFSRHTEDLSPGYILSDRCRDYLQREKPRYTRVFETNKQIKHPCSQNTKRFLLIKESQTSQVNEFSTFL